MCFPPTEDVESWTMRGTYLSLDMHEQKWKICFLQKAIETTRLCTRYWIVLVTMPCIVLDNYIGMKWYLKVLMSSLITSSGVSDKLLPRNRLNTNMQWVANYHRERHEGGIELRETVAREWTVRIQQSSENGLSAKVQKLMNVITIGRMDWAQQSIEKKLSSRRMNCMCATPAQHC